jgi:hypothetical protein
MLLGAPPFFEVLELTDTGEVIDENIRGEPQT